jgi:uncharacterized membrane protein YuzA (DUF378 family)
MKVFPMRSAGVAARVLHAFWFMKDNSTNALSKTLISISIIGALNWGLIGFFNFNLVDAIFGGGSHEVTSAFSRVIYAIVGLAGLAAAVLLPKLHAEPMHRDLASRGA